MADQEVIKHVKAAISTSRDKNKSWQVKLREILLEIVIIVFAVSLSIWLHSWAEGRKDRQDEHEFLVGLKQDIGEDMQEMQSDSLSNELRRRYSEYFERVGGGEKVNMDTANAYSWVFGSWSTIDPRISRFEALKGSGKLGIIEDKDLLNRITELYAKDFPLIRNLNQLASDLKMNHMLPYLAAHAQLDAKGAITNWDVLLRQSEMRILVRTQGSLTDNLAAYGKAIKHCRGILEEIGREVWGGRVRG